MQPIELRRLWYPETPGQPCIGRGGIGVVTEGDIARPVGETVFAAGWSIEATRRGGWGAGIAVTRPIIVVVACFLDTNARVQTPPGAKCPAELGKGGGRQSVDFVVIVGPVGLVRTEEVLLRL